MPRYPRRTPLATSRSPGSRQYSLVLYTLWTCGIPSRCLVGTGCLGLRGMPVVTGTRTGRVDLDLSLDRGLGVAVGGVLGTASGPRRAGGAFGLDHAEGCCWVQWVVWGWVWVWVEARTVEGTLLGARDDG